MVTFCNTRVWSENLEKHFHLSKNLCSWRFCGAVFPWLMRCSWQAKDHVKQILHYMVHSTGSPLIGCPLIVLRFLKNVHSSHSTSMNFSIVLFWAMFLYFILIVRISHSTVFWCSTLTVLWGDSLYNIFFPLSPTIPIIIVIFVQFFPIRAAALLIDCTVYCI